MKKTLVLMLSLCMLFACLYSCSSEDPVQNDGGKNTETGTGIRLLRYTWDGWGIEPKYLESCDLVDRMLNTLNAMQETGETVAKISDDVLSSGAVPHKLPVERGTLWIEAGDRIYRMTPELSQICLVETHFGEGRILALPEGFSKDVGIAWAYAPYDYYVGTYNPGEYTVALENVFKSDSTIKIKIKKVTINDDSPNTMTVELVSTIDQEITVNLHSQQSADCFGLGDRKNIVLKKNTPATLELQFSGIGLSKYREWVYIEADNTRVRITVNPEENI